MLNSVLHGKHGKMSTWRYLALGYFLVILVGSILLVLPVSWQGGEGHTYLNSLFTATSAACVTGLVPFDTGLSWSIFGQVVILILIQLGGLGFTTFVSVLFLLVKRGFGLYERNAVIRSLGGSKLSGVSTLVKRIVVGTFVLEFLGAAVLCIRFVPDFGVKYGIYYAIFHAVSAFCNAGFDLMGKFWGVKGSFSLSHYATDPLVSLTLCLLIILGGLGFCVWGDIFDCKGNPRKFSFYTRLILTVNTVLLVLSTALFLLFERNCTAWEGYNFGQKLLCSFFNATTARTAGFYTTDPATLSASGYLLTVALMFIGGSSGSTAGGIKVGTFAVLIMGMVAVLRGKQDVEIGKRRVHFSQLWQALAIFTVYLMLAIVSTMLICAFEPNVSFSAALFETVSALGTVGLSISLTPMLGAASKIILIFLMYAGRVGVLTIALALTRKRTEAKVKRPVETIFIG